MRNQVEKIWILCTFALALSHIQSVISENDPVGESDPSDKDSAESGKVHSRHKRYVYINVASPLACGYLIAVPYTFALPRFNLETSRRRKRAAEIERERDLLANLTAEEILPSDSFDEPAYGIELAKLTAYFAYLGIDEDICQQRLICEIFSDPHNHRPLSEMLANKLLADHGPIAEKPSNRFYRYVLAFQEGLSGGEEACQTRYQRCPYSVGDRVHLPALHFWNFLASMLDIEIKDD